MMEVSKKGRYAPFANKRRGFDKKYVGRSGAATERGVR
jgi:hypothetical protein